MCGSVAAAKVALAASCNLEKGFQTYISDSIARHHLGGALPFVFDDPSDNSVLKQMLINAFGGAEPHREAILARGVFQL